jgi:lipoprotein-releasing system permease protein
LYNEIKPTIKQPVDLYSHYASQEKVVKSIKPKTSQIRIHNAIPLIAFLSEQAYVKGVTAQVKAQAFYLGGTTQINGVISGIEVLKEGELYNLNEYIIEGSLKDLAQNENGIILGAGVSKKLSLQVGAVIQIATPKGDIQAMKIVGLYQSGIADVDNVQSYVNIKMAQRIMGQSNNYITDINIKLFNMEQAPALAIKMSDLFDLTAIDIQTANAQFETGSSIRTLISYAVSITLLIVAGFGIYNILNMLIYEKMNDIAILKATGFSGKDVKWIFISQALIIGFIGGLLGLILGYIVTVIIDRTPFDTAALPTIKTYPINYEIGYYIIGITFAMISTFFAGYFPSRKAEKIDPVDIIRGQ